MKKKALSLFMAAVMIATTPAGTALGSENETAQTIVVSEADETEVEASSISEETAESDEDAAAEKAASVDDGEASSWSENTASESVGTDEVPGVSDEEPAADAAGTAETAAETKEEITKAEEAAEAEETETAGAAEEVCTEAESDATADVPADEEAEKETAAESSALAASLDADSDKEEAAVSEEEPYITFDYDNMVTYYRVLAGSTDTITFEVLLSSYSGTLTYQWSVWDDYEEEYADISGATGSTYTFTPSEEEGWAEYSCTVTAANSEGSVSENVGFSIYVSETMVVNYTYYHKVELGGSTTLTVEAQSPNSTITYEWYSYDENDGTAVLVSNVTGSALSLTNITSSRYYECIVSDGVSVSYADFYVEVNSGLTVNADSNTNVTIEADETAALSVTASTNYGSLTYQWYGQNETYYYTAIDGATGSSYKTSEAGSYYCRVSDGYNTQNIYFYVTIDSGLTVEGDYYNEIELSPGESKELSVAAESEYALTYQWYVYRSNEGENAIDGATSATCTVSTGGNYRCVVSDGYNAISVTFSVKVNSGLSVSYNNTVYAIEGGTAAMTVYASVNTGSLSYSWYYYDEASGSNVYLSETGNELQIENITEEREYGCIVADDYGNSEYVWFSVKFVTALSVSYEDYYEVAPNGSTTISVQAVSPVGDITYQWYVLDDSEEEYVELDAASAAVTVTPTSSYTEYKCVVSDGVTTKNIYIDVEWTSNLTMNYTSGVCLDPGETGTIEVKAFSDLENPEFTFTWYLYNEENDEYEQIGEPVSNGTNTATLTVSEAGEYRCMVSDSFETRNVYCTVEINSGYEVSANTKARLVASGGSTTLSVNASTEIGTLTYSWYYYDDEGEKVSAGTGASLSLSDLTVSRYYYCSVSDGYNGDTFSFRVVVVSEIGETATSFSAAKTMTAGTSQLATIASSNTSMYFKIVPNATGTYTFYSTGDGDTEGYLYSASKTELEYDDDGGDDLNFKISYTLTAGTTYYLAARYLSSSNVGTFDVYMVAGDSVCRHTNTTHTAAKAATCTAAGNIEYWVCSDCGLKFSDSALTTVVSDVTVAATGHKSVTHVAAKAATCTTAGNIEYWVCSDCGLKFSNSALTTTVSNVTIAATGHTASSAWTTTKAATCTTAGTKVQKCTRCGAVVNTATIAATGHSYGEWTTTKEATALAEGTMTRTCKCGATETKSIAKLTPTIKVNATTIKLKKKQSTTALKVTGLAAGDSVASWKSSNTKIVTVTSKGKITAKNKTGTAYITITLKSGLKKKIKVTVQKSAVKTTKITVAKKSVSLKKGKTYTIKPTISPITSIQKVTYTSSNKKVATVSSKGKITAKKKGTAKITVKSGSKKVTIKVTVK